VARMAELRQEVGISNGPTTEFRKVTPRPPGRHWRRPPAAWVRPTGGMLFPRLRRSKAQPLGAESGQGNDDRGTQLQRPRRRRSASGFQHSARRAVSSTEELLTNTLLA
jgi:hypothetical protein